MKRSKTTINYRARFVWLWMVFVVLAFMAFPQTGLLRASATTTSTPDDSTMDTSPTPIPSITPTLGTLITRTPGPAHVCPSETGQQATIALPADKFFDDKSRFVPDPIVTYLNATGSVRGLKQALEKLDYFFRIKIITADVTGDGVPEVLLDLTYKEFSTATLLILGCRDGKYIALHNDSKPDYTHAGAQVDTGLSGIQAIRDMNGDGLAEIVYDYLPQIGTHGYGQYFYNILEWNGNAFVNLSEVVRDPAGYEYSTVNQQNDGSNFVRDHGNGTYELVLTAHPFKDSYYGGSVAERNRETIFAWNGERFTRFCWRFTEPPKYIADAVMDGDNESNCRHFDLALRAYQQAIFSSGLLPWNNLFALGGNDCCESRPTLVPDLTERTIFEAYARYRIIVLHAAQNQPNDVATDFSILMQKYSGNQPGHDFMGLAQAFFDAYVSATDVTEGCRSAIRYAQAHPQIAKIFAKYVFETDAYSINAFALSDDIQQICPFK